MLKAWPSLPRSDAGPSLSELGVAPAQMGVGEGQERVPVRLAHAMGERAHVEGQIGGGIERVEPGLVEPLGAIERIDRLGPAGCAP